MDIHDFRKRLERAVKRLKEHPGVSEDNKQLIMRFIESIKAEGLSLARQTGYVQRLTLIAHMLRKDFQEATREDVEAIMTDINTDKRAEWTKDNYRVAAKRFWRWLRRLEDNEDPPETSWIKVGKAKSRTILPEDLLAKQETQRLSEAAEHPRDKAYVALCDESGG